MNISMSNPFGLLAVCFLLLILKAPALAGDRNLSIDEMAEHIRERIAETVQIVEPQYNGRVRSYLRTYIELNPDKTEVMIGRAAMYFPIFEEYLARYNMPEDLKYMAIVESALVPVARSHVGAVGIWQFMRPTAREYGLSITQYIDERRDPEKATDAAVRYLRDLYARFGSWELAMAAYNAGPGRVSYAIRRAGTKDYWQLSRYLPRETRAYVPGFIAANYLFHHYDDHGLVPQQLEDNLLNTAEIVLYDGMSFMDVNAITGVPLQTITELNPMYARRYVPRSVYGYTIKLPVHAIFLMRQHLGIPDSGDEAEESPFTPIVTGRDITFVEELTTYEYKVRAGDNLYNIGQEHGCSVGDLMQWNRLTSSNLRIGQRLRIQVLQRRAIVREHIDRTVEPMARLTFPVTSLIPLSNNLPVPYLSARDSAKSPVQIPESHIVLRRRMSLKDALRAEHVRRSVSDVALPGTTPMPGFVVTLEE